MATTRSKGESTKRKRNCRIVSYDTAVAVNEARTYFEQEARNNRRRHLNKPVDRAAACFDLAPLTIINIRKRLETETSQMNYSYGTKRSYYQELKEDAAITALRIVYIRQMKKYHAEGRRVFYQDEMWVNKNMAPAMMWLDADGKGGIKASQGKGEHSIICHIGDSSGFVYGARQIFRGSKSLKDSDYHTDMNSDVLHDEVALVSASAALAPRSLVAALMAALHGVRRLHVPVPISLVPMEPPTVQWRHVLHEPVLAVIVPVFARLQSLYRYPKTREHQQRHEIAPPGSRDRPQPAHIASRSLSKDGEHLATREVACKVANSPHSERGADEARDDHERRFLETHGGHATKDPEDDRERQQHRVRVVRVDLVAHAGVERHGEQHAAHRADDEDARVIERHDHAADEDPAKEERDPECCDQVRLVCKHVLHCARDREPAAHKPTHKHARAEQSVPKRAHAEPDDHGDGGEHPGGDLDVACVFKEPGDRVHGVVRGRGRGIGAVGVDGALDVQLALLLLARRCALRTAPERGLEEEDEQKSSRR